MVNHVRPDVAAAIGRMTRTVSVGRELRGLDALVRADEAVRSVVRATDGVGFGVAVLTDRRLVFHREGLLSRRTEEIPLGAVVSVGWTGGRGVGDLEIVTAGNRLVLQHLGRRDGDAFVEELRAATAPAARPASPGRAPAAPPRPVRSAAFPTLVRHGWGRTGYYLVGDPAVVTARHRIDDDGTVTRELSETERLGVGLALVVAGGLLAGLVAALVGTELRLFAPWAILGAIASVVAVRRCGAGLDRVLDRVLRLPAGATVRVEPGHAQAWELCEIAAGLAGTRSWLGYDVDERRRAPQLLWDAVHRSIQLDAELVDVRRAQAHVALQELVQQTSDRIAAERAVLESVRSNLRTVLDVAVGMDRRADARAEAARLQREQDELRDRLAGRAGVVAGGNSHD